jgi:hypothetical protein
VSGRGYRLKSIKYALALDAAVVLDSLDALRELFKIK